MKLNTSEWQEFFLHDLYEVRMGNGFDKNKMTYDDPSVNFVSRVSYNNGVDDCVDYIDDTEPFEAGLLTVALGGSYLGSCFVQEEPFYTAQNVAVLFPRYKEMNAFVNVFISGLIRYESKIKYYAFGRELNAHIGREFTIKLPVCKGGIPNWPYMEKYIKTLHYKPLTTSNKSNNIPDLDLNKWKEFVVGRLFVMLNGKGITQEEIAENEGDFTAIQSGEDNNGVIGKIDLNYCKQMNYTYTLKPCLTVARSGSAGYVAFQNNGCVVGDSAKILLLPDEVASVEHYLFLQTILTANRFKYTYGRKVTADKYLNDIINLPIKYNPNHTPFYDSSHRYSDAGYVPDWDFMEKYMKSLPYGDRL